MPSKQLPVTQRISACLPRLPYGVITQLARSGPAPLLSPTPGMAERNPLHFAFVIPPFRKGSGGHNSIFQIVYHLEQIGHTCSIWIDDPHNHQQDWPGAIRHAIMEHFAPVQAPVFKGFEQWFGADVAIATGWQTVYPTLLLDQCRARAYLVHDHESEFYATSAEQHWAEQTYHLGLAHIAASPWLRKLITAKCGDDCNEFQFGVNHHIYHPQPITRRNDTVLFYGRGITPRRAVPLGLLALSELKQRRPDLRIVLFGDEEPPATDFPYEHLGIATPAELATTYSAATVGLVLSMTNYSLIPQEMMACGLPCVDLAGYSAESVFEPHGPLELAAPDPLAIADAIELLLEDQACWERHSQAGIEFVANHTWVAAAQQVETALRAALRRRCHKAFSQHECNA